MLGGRRNERDWVHTQHAQLYKHAHIHTASLHGVWQTHRQVKTCADPDKRISVGTQLGRAASAQRERQSCELNVQCMDRQRDLFMPDVSCRRQYRPLCRTFALEPSPACSPLPTVYPLFPCPSPPLVIFQHVPLYAEVLEEEVAALKKAREEKLAALLPQAAVVHTSLFNFIVCLKSSLPELRGNEEVAFCVHVVCDVHSKLCASHPRV